MVTGPVHFIWLGGQDFVWQHWRAIETARQVQGEPIFWTTKEAIEKWMPPSASVNEQGQVTYISLAGVEVRWIDLPDWLRDHPIQLANVKDLFVWRILYEYGGLYLDLDTISLRPVWDLLEEDVLVSTEWPNPSDGEHLYNSAVVAAVEGSPVLRTLERRALEILQGGESRWGKTGPHLLTEIVRENPDAFTAAPFGVLNGWRDDTIEEYYDGARPGPHVRVIHLYSSSRPERFAADRWWPNVPVWS